MYDEVCVCLAFLSWNVLGLMNSNKLWPMHEKWEDTRLGLRVWFISEQRLSGSIVHSVTAIYRIIGFSRIDPFNFEITYNPHFIRDSKRDSKRIRYIFTSSVLWFMYEITLHSLSSGRSYYLLTTELEKENEKKTKKPHWIETITVDCRVILHSLHATYAIWIHMDDAFT